MTELSLMLRGLVALVVPGVSLEPLAEAEHRRALSRNEQLRCAPPEAHAKHLRECGEAVSRRLRLLRRNLVLSFAFIASAIATAAGSRAFAVVPESLDPLLGGGSVFLFAWATLGRLGWFGQSWKGDTVVERLDARIFWLLYWLGTFLGSLAVL